MSLLSPNQRARIKEMLPAIARLRRWQHRLARRGSITAYLRSTAEPCLHFGCGGNVLTGWLNTDRDPQHGRIVPIDVTVPLPFPARIFHYAFSEHMIEHISLTATEALLAELFRVLRPGAIIRIATPDLRRVIGIYSRPEHPPHAAYIKWSLPRYAAGRLGNPACQVLNSLFYAHEHRFLFDAESLGAYLEAAGFRDCTPEEPGESRHARLKGLEGHDKVIGAEFNKLETFVLEARRP